MKRLTWLALVLFWVGNANAQSDQMIANPTDLNQAVKEMSDLYRLDPIQTERMLVIQRRRLEQINSVDHLRNENFEQYLRKRRSIRRGAEGAIRKMLTPEQVPVFNRQLADRRHLESDLIKKMKNQGASREMIELEVLKLEDTKS